MHTLKIYKDEICLNDNTFIVINDSMWSLLLKLFSPTTNMEIVSEKDKQALFLDGFLVSSNIWHDIILTLHSIFEVIDVEVEIYDERTDYIGLVL